MGQHLGTVKTQNALRSHLEKREIDILACSFELIAHGPIYPEVADLPGASRTDLMKEHLPIRNLVGAMEKALAEELREAGYTVLNQVKWSHRHDPAVWGLVRAAFAEKFPRLNR
jgi:hypothetical protein